MLLVDTNVLVDLLENDPQWHDWPIDQSCAQAKIHRLAINPIIIEFSYPLTILLPVV